MGTSEDGNYGLPQGADVPQPREVADRAEGWLESQDLIDEPDPISVEYIDRQLTRDGEVDAVSVLISDAGGIEHRIYAERGGAHLISESTLDEERRVRKRPREFFTYLLTGEVPESSEWLEFGRSSSAPEYPQVVPQDDFYTPAGPQ